MILMSRIDEDHLEAILLDPSETDRVVRKTNQRVFVTVDGSEWTGWHGMTLKAEFDSGVLVRLDSGLTRWFDVSDLDVVFDN